ncbi:MAG: hypothetical protein LBJ44_02125 [Propionibacteriaceae bacterium]|jgi:hypothetical protein|nr:hypothetical protein [Propionibacteriaceae bacterium]
MKCIKPYFLIVLVLMFGSCAVEQSSPEPSSEARIADSLVTLFQRELEREQISDFEREIFTRAVETGRIDPADYEEAHLRYDRCMRDAGFPLTYSKRSSGVYSTDTWIGESAELLGDQGLICSRGVLARVEALFNLQQNNPDLLVDDREVAVRCLAKAGLVPSSYAVEDFQRDFIDWGADSEGPPFDPMDPVANDCLAGAGYEYWRDY